MFFWCVHAVLNFWKLLVCVWLEYTDFPNNFLSWFFYYAWMHISHAMSFCTFAIVLFPLLASFHVVKYIEFSLISEKKYFANTFESWRTTKKDLSLNQQYIYFFKTDDHGREKYARKIEQPTTTQAFSPFWCWSILFISSRSDYHHHIIFDIIILIMT